MTLLRSATRPRPGRILLRSVIFLAVFAAVLIPVVHFYLLPAMAAAKDASPDERKKLSATAVLVMMVVLFLLLAALVLTFRLGRYFIPRPPTARAKPTEYPDAWAEAGRRMKVTDEDSE